MQPAPVVGSIEFGPVLEPGRHEGYCFPDSPRIPPDVVLVFDDSELAESRPIDEAPLYWAVRHFVHTFRHSDLPPTQLARMFMERWLADEFPRPDYVSRRTEMGDGPANGYSASLKVLAQRWVIERCTLRQQGVLEIATRGPDGVPKEDKAKPIVRALRACCWNCGDTGEPLAFDEDMAKSKFMQMSNICNAQRWVAVTNAFFASIDQYNVHFLQHLLHAAMVVGFKHPEAVVGGHWQHFYRTGVRKLHMHPETEHEMDHRLRDGFRPEHDNE